MDAKNRWSDQSLRMRDMVALRCHVNAKRPLDLPAVSPRFIAPLCDSGAQNTSEECYFWLIRRLRWPAFECLGECSISRLRSASRACRQTDFRFFFPDLKSLSRHK